MLKNIIIFILIFVSVNFGQEVAWQNITGDFDLPEGVSLFKGDATKLNAWYLDIDLNNGQIAIRPYLAIIPAGKEGVPAFCRRVGAFAAINGGYFDTNGTTSYSAVVYPGQVLTRNIAAVSRSGVTYPVARSLFGIKSDREMAIDWIYHFGSQVSDIYAFDQPLPNAEGSPAPIPDKSAGMPFSDLLVGIGGGPTLIKEGEINITYNEEVFWGSGIGNETLNPRTAVGYTAANHAIFLVVDGRQPASMGVGLPELAQIMQTLGCVAAMNLDGGGSTQMAVGGTLINRPEGGAFTRPVPTILAVVHADSLPVPGEDYFEKIIDSGDTGCELIGPGWFPTANAGFWGETPSMLNSPGTGERYAAFTPLLPPAKYELFAWWVAAGNRCTDTPIIIRHRDGTDTVRVNQTLNGSKWNSVGHYSFSGDSTEKMIISNAATRGSYIVADAVRFVAPKNPAAIQANRENQEKESDFRLSQNFPNPFNSTTQIHFQVPHLSRVRLKVYNVLGQHITTLIAKNLEAGSYIIPFNANELASGIFLYELTAGKYHIRKRMILLK